MRLCQYRETSGARAVAVSDGAGPKPLRLDGVSTIYALAQAAIRAGQSLEAIARAHLSATPVDLDAAEAEGRLLPPLDHAEPGRCWVTGTGLTHTGGAAARDQMHRKIGGAEAELSDSMKLFRWGVEGGKPADGGPGSQPEWFYKGNGSTLVAAGLPLALPDFAWDGGEEPEIAGLYVVADDGTPCRVGFALGNEYTDHVMERKNYLYLAHSKLRVASVGPELLLGEPPADVQGRSRVLRAGQTIWEKPFVSGEANLTHRFAGLEHHHFKYPLFRAPGDVHVHFFGTGTLSFADGVKPEVGDVFEIEAVPFGRPLRNRLERATWAGPKVRVL